MVTRSLGWLLVGLRSDIQSRIRLFIWACHFYEVLFVDETVGWSFRMLPTYLMQSCLEGNGGESFHSANIVEYEIRRTGFETILLPFALRNLMSITGVETVVLQVREGLRQEKTDACLGGTGPVYSAGCSKVVSGWMFRVDHSL